ncbi:hypothetical protein OPR88_23745 [Enterobacter hormaechei]|uniref:hypothetical protein n=1 Tax=Enterobacter cloacae complex sp. 2022EL-00759 TaxID=2998099 RepID=UPI0012F29EC7|nr:hypothetical protein [Enterobacter cloacae complex sp. 2022EL-00759]EBK1945006.1 hypothetical protein [Salmonella enterica subsp. enterica serovar Montevideo]EHA1927409.1 hypothetical protein [Salmonella enterica]MCW7769304.1 hypothetical protein [Enterobacter hormaechei]EBM9362666.1 hypothetical protein [Salmonella enterica subsp. enterica serovar Montevideo]EDN4114018.1 hypothetical protein [Salmonella enterica subsp. enterica serovar Montevideo]
MNTRTITMDLDRMEPTITSRLNMDYISEQGFMVIDEVDNFPMPKSEYKRIKFNDVKITLSDTEQLINLIEKKALVLAVKYQGINTSDMDITLSTERGYVCAEFCGGVYEVSLRTDIGAGRYEASVGNELVMFSRLNDAVESFFDCIEEAVKEVIRKEARDN